MDQKTNWKYILIILILALISVGGIFLYFKNFSKEIILFNKFIGGTKTEGTAEAVNWKFYRNEQYGFEVKYPQNWTVSAEANSVLNAKFPIQVDGIRLSEKDSSWKGFFTIQVFEKEDLTLDQWIKKYQPIDDSGKSLITMTSDTTIGGIPAKYFEIEGVDNRYDSILADKNDYFFFIIRYLPDVDNNPAGHKEITNQILSSFKFIK